MDALGRIRAAVGGNGDREAKAVKIADAIRTAAGYRWVGVYGVEATEIAAIAWSGPGGPAHPRFPRDQGLCGAAVAAGETVVVDDVGADPRYLTTFGSTRSELVVPVRIEGDVRGLIDVESDRPAAFDAEDRAFVERCAEAAALLWEHA
jgi:GAF domain-containing protein